MSVDSLVDSLLQLKREIASDCELFASSHSRDEHDSTLATHEAPRVERLSRETRRMVAGQPQRRRRAATRRQRPVQRVLEAAHDEYKASGSYEDVQEEPNSLDLQRESLKSSCQANAHSAAWTGLDGSVAGSRTREPRRRRLRRVRRKGTEQHDILALMAQRRGTLQAMEKALFGRALTTVEPLELEPQQPTEAPSRRRPVVGVSRRALDNLPRAFATADIDGSGLVSRPDFSRTLRYTGALASPDQIAAVMDELDPDNTGEVPYRLFIDNMSRAVDAASDERPQGGPAPFAPPPDSERQHPLEIGFRPKQHAYSLGSTFLPSNPVARLPEHTPDTALPPKRKPRRRKQAPPAAPRFSDTSTAVFLLHKVRRPQRLEKAMHRLDRTRSGFVSASEFARALRDLGIRLGTQRLGSVMEQLDPARTDYIAYQPLVAKLAELDEQRAARTRERELDQQLRLHGFERRVPRPARARRQSSSQTAAPVQGMRVLRLKGGPPPNHTSSASETSSSGKSSDDL